MIQKLVVNSFPNAGISMRCSEREVRIIRLGVLREEQRALAPLKSGWPRQPAARARRDSIIQLAHPIENSSHNRVFWFLLNAETKFERFQLSKNEDGRDVYVLVMVTLFAKMFV
jgi:hypothetical protein